MVMECGLFLSIVPGRSHGAAIRLGFKEEFSKYNTIRPKVFFFYFINIVLLDAKPKTFEAVVTTLELLQFNDFCTLCLNVFFDDAHISIDVDVPDVKVYGEISAPP